MATKLLKTPFVFVCFVLVIYMMRQNGISPSNGLRHSLRLLNQRLLSSGRPSEELCSGVSIEGTYSQEEIEKASTIKSPRGDNDLKEWVLNGNEDSFVDDYAKPLIPMVAPWPVLAVITLLSCIGFVCNWCCIFGCCKNCCKGCKCCKQNKQQSKMKIYMAISGLFLLGTLGAAAAGLNFAPKVSKGMNLTFCTALTSVENLVYGETEQEWIGFNGILTSLEDVANKFMLTVSGLNDISQSPTNFNTKHQTARDRNQDLYDNNNGYNDVPRGNPAQASTYTPDYVAKLGDPDNSGTYTNLIKVELDNWYSTISSSVASINSAITSLKGSQNDIQQAIDTGLESAQGIKDSLSDVIDSLGDSGQTVQDGVKIAGYVLVALFAVNLGFAVVAILSIGMIKFMKIKFFTKILHFSWCIINLMTLFGFLIATLTLPVSIIVVESCEIFQLTLNDQDFFETVTDKLFSGGSSDAKDILNTCFYGSGKALDELGLTEDLNFFDTIYVELDKVNTLINFDTYGSANPPPSLVIPVQQTLVNNVLSGVIPDKDTTATDLARLNQGTNTAYYSCISLKDMWMLGSTACTDSSYLTFASGDSETANLPGKTCLGFDNWGSKDITVRYTTTYFPTSCTNPDLTTVQAFVNGFVANRNKVTSYFNAIKTDLGNVATAQHDFAVEVGSYLDSLRAVRNQVASLKDSLIGETNGLIPNTNCKFVGNDLRKLQVAMCASLGSSMYQASVCMIIMAVMSFLGTIFTFILAKRFSIKPDNQRAVSPMNGAEPAKYDPFSSAM